MYAYYRTSSQSTVNQRILRGSISAMDASDLVLVKGNALEWMSIGTVLESDPNLLTQQMEQSTFGIINDARVLECEFSDDLDLDLTDVEETAEEEKYEETSYSRKIRKHSIIKGRGVLVALSEYGKLVFMTIHYNKSLDVRRFETLTEIYLDSPGLEYTKIGKRLAIDPYSRAIAIGSFQDHFDILILNKTMSRVRFDPIVCRGSESEEGIIWHMEFLQTESASMERILLALVIYNDIDRSCRLVVYAIDASDIKNVLIEKVGRLPLEKNTPLPLLLIPLKFQPETFILVTEQQVCLLTADDLTCGNVLYPTSFIPRPFGSTECPLFTSYASHLDDREEYIYLGSAEGCLYKLNVLSTGETKWTPIDQTNPISQSMCMLGTVNMTNGGNQEPFKADVVLFSGESADSHVLAIACEKSPHQPTIKHIILQTLVNRAPLTDFQVADNFRDHQDVLIACTGQSNHGSLSIISHGIEASALHTSKPEWAGVSRLWNLTVSSPDSQDTSCLLASSALDTRLLSAKDGHIKDITSTSSIEFDSETIHASAVDVRGHKMILQVRPNGLSIIELGRQGCGCISVQWRPTNSSRIELATSWCDKQVNYIAICFVDNGQFLLKILQINDRYEDQSLYSLTIQTVASVPLKYCPSYINHLNIESQNLVSVGTFYPSILLYKIQDNNIHCVQEIDLSCLTPGQFAVPHSSAIIYSFSDEPYFFLVGLRQGSVLSFKMDIHASKLISDDRPHLHNIGSRAVRLSPLYQSKDAVYALSEQLWKLTGSERNELEMEHILLPRFNKSVDAFTAFDCDLPLLHTTGEPLAVVADDKLQIFQLGFQSQTNTFKINLGETTRKVIYDKTLNYIITITSSMEGGERKNSISLVDPFSGQLLAESQLLWTDTDYGRSDMVLSATEWSVENDGKLYKYLCVGIGHPKEPFHSVRSGMSARVSETLMNKGTLLLFRLKVKPKKSSGFTLSRVWVQDRLPGGVFAIRPHPAGLLFSAGHHLYLYKLVNGSLVEVAQVPLRFTVTSIQDMGDRICVGSHTDSLSFYRFNPTTNQLEFLKSDVVSRSIHHSLMLSDRLAVGFSQSGGMVALYDNPNDKSFESRLECLFCFHYPDIIIKPSLALLRSQHDLDSEFEVLAHHLIPWSDPVNENQSRTHISAMVKPIVGCTVSGGIVHVYRTSKALYNLLHILQNRLIDYTPTQPLLGSTKDFRKWYCHLSGEEKNAIHGDLVEAYLRLSEQEQLTVIQNEEGDVLPELSNAIDELNAESIHGHFDDHRNQIYFINNVLSGFERYR